jgi:hypothetical protein
MRYYARAFRRSAVTGAETTLFNWFTRARQWYFSQPMPTFEAVTLGLALLVGVLIMPALIYLAGITVLKEYANGGLFALYGDYFKGLFEPRGSCWVVLFGPFVFLCVGRLFRLVLRKT